MYVVHEIGGENGRGRVNLVGKELFWGNHVAKMLSVSVRRSGGSVLRWSSVITVIPRNNSWDIKVSVLEIKQTFT